MRTRRFKSQSASALVVTVIAAGLIGFGIASYLGMTSFQRRSSMRSQVYNSILPIAEAGIEEAMSHLYFHYSNLSTDSWTQVTSLALSNGIALPGTQYFKQRAFGEGRYTVAISQSSTPTIVSQGYVSEPFQTNELIRTIRVTTASQSMFMKGLVAKGSIGLNGSVKTDSFDSSNPSFSTGGQYDPAKSKDNGDIASVSSAANVISANGNVSIYGHVSTGPGGSISTVGNAAMGSKAFIDGGGSGIEPGWSSDDMNASFPDVQIPFSGGAFTPPSGSVGGTNYTYVVGNGNWQLSSLSMSGKKAMLVNGNAVLYVTGDISMAGQAYIAIAPGASLQLYCAGSSASLSGNGIVNSNSNATNFFYYGMPGNTSLSLSGNAAFTGVIYAPQADFSMNGGGSSSYDLVGAGVVNSISMNGHFNFHYDEALGNLGSGAGFIVTSWNEL
ncbi:MAG: hypothetical protein O2960_24210 [Verrucomicrobia bacterium]|nr:hypothetical protein [Verrucomicrobiota bacterium]